MKTKLYLVAVLAIALVACNEPIGETSLIEGGWELQRLTSDKTVSADLTGNTHLSEEPSTKEYKNKEMVWLFYDAHISKWSQYSEEGETFWGGYYEDAEHTYAVEGEGDHMYIIETTTSIIPGIEWHSSVNRYHVEKLTKTEMVLTKTETMYVSEKDSMVDVFQTYIFKRENTLLDWFSVEKEAYDSIWDVN